MFAPKSPSVDNNRRKPSLPAARTTTTP
jgi:hypothetical protein